MNSMIAAALEENPIAFKREFEAAMATRVDTLKAQTRIDVAHSIRVEGEEETSDE